MGKILRSVSNGIVEMVDVFLSPRGYVRPSKAEFQRDRERQFGDVRKLDSDMRNALDKTRDKHSQKSTSHAS